MGALTESEIFDQMNTSFRLAIEHCDELTKRPVGGIVYDQFRKQLRLIEGCCKQANTWREDTRWLVFIKLCSETHQRAGDWLRGIKEPSGRRVKIANGQLHPAFQMLSVNLQAMHKLSHQIRTAKTGRLGMILPTPLRGPHRDTVPVGYRAPQPNISKGGIIIPSGTTIQ